MIPGSRSSILICNLLPSAAASPPLSTERLCLFRLRVQVSPSRLCLNADDAKVILAGRSLNDSESSQFGIVIFEAGSLDEARKIMEGDDAVKAKIMMAQLFPFSVALRR